MGLHRGWYEDAKHVTVSELSDFVASLLGEYEHDYGTICHAVAAAAVAAAHAVNNDKDQGGITGFQAGAVMWCFIENWMVEYRNKPKRLINYESLLYPQYEDKFTGIPQKAWEWVQREAQHRLDETDGQVDGEVREHWEKIAGGEVPFDLRVVEE